MKEKKQKKSEIRSFNLDRESLDGLAKLEKITKKKQSEILRLLIPSGSLVDAAIEITQQVNEKASLEDVSKTFLGAFTHRLVSEMQEKCGADMLHYQITSAYLQPNPNKAMAKLFTKFSKALKKDEGYSLQSVKFIFGDGKGREQYVVLGPGEDCDEIVKQIKGFWKGLLK